ncbi:amidase [Mesorhizobium sp.]|uniref:amidase n=1 Tax=Mesorhizobium sp. TaxID=1871066 RepID=UPI0025E866AA|nr:amidase [Mesorhizobium sp.]
MEQVTCNMRVEEYVSYDATGLAALVNAGKVRPHELAQLAREACNRINGQINAVIEVYDDAETVSGADEGVFHGVPFVRKDLGASERGRLQERGSRLYKGYRSETDSYFFQRAQAAGLRTLGRTTTPEFGLAGVTESLLNGITRNPWNLDVSAGGSSGGAAAAVAAGIVPIAHASDGGGSIRIPATFTNLVGFNPSRGRISGGPDRQDSGGGMSRTFVLCRSVRDMAAALDVFSGTFPGDPFVIQQPEGPYLEELNLSTQKLRIGVALSKWGEQDLEPEIVSAVSRSAKLLEEMGHDVEEIAPPFSHADYFETYLGLELLGMSRLAAVAASLEREIGPATLEPVSLEIYRASQLRPLCDAAMTFDLIRKLRMDVAEATSRYDLLLTPVTPRVSMEHELHSQTNSSYSLNSWVEIGVAGSMYTFIFNITGQPSVSLPLFQSDKGMPIGVQVVGRFGDEATLVRLSRDLEEALPWGSRRPPIFAGTPSRIARHEG